MKTIAIKVAMLAGFMIGLSGTAWAEQRVLLSFDSVGHELIKVVRTHNASSKRAKAVIPSRVVDIESMYEGLSAGVATLIWTDADGYLQGKTTAPDPRISRGPAHIIGLDKSLQAVSEGAWLVSGPQSASRLIILMPNYEALDLSFERWEVELI